MKLNTELRQELYLIADEMRGMATIGDYFANNPYEQERAARIMKLAAKIAALADDEYSADKIEALFDKRPWFRLCPIMGVDAAVFNAAGELLLIQRKDNQTWAMPGGIAEIGDTLAETALKELWEEAGLKGEVKRLLGVFDGRYWGSRSPIHNMLSVFEVHCPTLEPTPGLETLDVGFFNLHNLPELHNSHQQRVPLVFKLREQATFFDAASSIDQDMPTFQRPDSSMSE